jgi:hypothetical protein
MGSGEKWREAQTFADPLYCFGAIPDKSKTVPRNRPSSVLRLSHSFPIYLGSSCSIRASYLTDMLIVCLIELLAITAK